MEEITKIVRKVGNGVTKPHIGTIKQEKIVIKSAANPENTFAVINEIIGYNMASEFDIELPAYRLASITQNTKVDSNDIFEDMIKPGTICFCTEYKRVFSLVSFEQIKTIPTETLLIIMFFDVLVCNNDRNQGNFLVEICMDGVVKLLPIDYTHAFHLGTIWDWGQFGKVTADDTADISQYLCASYELNILNEFTVTTDEFTAASELFISKAKNIKIADIFSLIPRELRRDISNNDILLFEIFLTARVQTVELIIEQVFEFLKERGVIV